MTVHSKILSMVKLGIVLTTSTVFVSAVHAADDTVVRMQGLDGGTSALAVMTIEHLGLLKKYNVKAQFQYLSATASSQNFLQGLSDVNFDSSITDVLVANSRQYGYASLAPEAINHAKIVASKDSPYNSMKDLLGKKIGWYSSDSTGSLTMAALLADEGINFFNDYKFIKSSPAALVKLLANGDVDAILDFQPWISWAETQVKSGIKTIYDPNVAWKKKTGGVLWMTGLTVKRAWANSHPEKIQAVQKMWCEAADYINSNPQKIMEVPNIQKALKPLDEKGREIFVSWISENKPFRCEWTPALRENGMKFLELLNNTAKFTKSIPQDIYLEK